MGVFPDPLHDEFASWILGFAPYGGGDVGEIQYLATQVEAGDDDSFFEVFSTFAKRMIDEATGARARGHARSARELYLRASVYLGIAYHPLYGKPVDPRLVDSFHLQMEAFDAAMALGDPPGRKLGIPYEDTEIPGYFLAAPGAAGGVRPTVLIGGGWDSTMVENYFGLGAAALARGYHVLLHDGPGQGRLLIEEGLTLRHDWERVVTPVVDAARAIDQVDRDRIVYEPWSLGGYMAPRVAAFEHRLAAVVADPGQMDVGAKLVDGLRLMGLTDEMVARLPDLDPEFAATATTAMEADRSLNWTLTRRGFWTNGATDLQSFLTELLRWKLDADTVAQIRCPTLVTSADGDRASTNAQELYDALTCPKQHLHFSTAEGAGMHCEMLNRSLANRRILDWVDDTLAPR